MILPFVLASRNKWENSQRGFYCCKMPRWWIQSGRFLSRPWPRECGQKYGILSSEELFFKHFPNSTMDKVQEEFGYSLNKEFTVKINGQGPLKVGQNSVKSFGDGNPLFQNQLENFTILPLNTHFNGLCHKIEPYFQIIHNNSWCKNSRKLFSDKFDGGNYRDNQDFPDKIFLLLYLS